ncbi:MAG: hypothetical protein AAF570_27045 [Bacteroidota bacterium]
MKYTLVDGHHRSSVLSELKYTHVLAEINFISKEKPVIVDEMDGDEETIIRFFRSYLALEQLSIRRKGIPIGNVVPDDSKRDDAIFKGMTQRQIRDYFFAKKHVQQFSYGLNKPMDYSFEVVDAYDDHKFKVIYRFGKNKEDKDIEGAEEGTLEQLINILREKFSQNPLFVPPRAPVR